MYLQIIKNSKMNTLKINLSAATVKLESNHKTTNHRPLSLRTLSSKHRRIGKEVCHLR